MSSTTLTTESASAATTSDRSTAPSPPHAHRRSEAIAAIASQTHSSQTPSSQTHSVPSLDDTHPVIGLIDIDLMTSLFEDLSTTFESPGGTSVLHAVACKAAPLRPLLNLYARLGAGCEVASPGELELALVAGFAPERIVFDSPAKTMSELRRALELGVSMNIDNFEELARIDELRSITPQNPAPTSAKIGLRINPQTGTGTIGALSTATETSKFGIGLKDAGARDAIIAAYLDRPWLNQIHVHSGSQGLSLELAAEGIAEVVSLAREINEQSANAGHDRQITRIDIGGGLPVNFDGEELTPSFADYHAVLETQVPELFEFDILTEFGRSLLAKAGTILTRVEFAKTTGGRRIAMTHAGVQVATRTAYAPEDWPLRILPFDAQGRPKTASPKTVELQSHDVAGPACFAGDLLARDRMLPRLDIGDLIAVPETGAYYFSNPFSYNLLPRVPVFGYQTSSAGELEFVLIRRGQTMAEILAEAGEESIETITSLTGKGAAE